MANDELLEQIRKVIREEVKAEIEPMKRDMATKGDIARVEQKLDESMKDNAGFFNQAGTFFDEMRTKIEKRIEDLEEVLLIPKN